MERSLVFFNSLQLWSYINLMLVSSLSIVDDTVYTGFSQDIYSASTCNVETNYLSVDGNLLQQQIDEVARFSDSPAPSVTRILYTDQDIAVRRYIRNLMLSSGLSIREDAVGNLFGRWEGSEPEAAAVATGSHTDAIPYAGKYDGVIGVLGAIEAVNSLKRAGFKPKKSLEIVVFTSEEPTRFGISCLGSRLLAGSENVIHLLMEKVRDNKNVTFAEAAKYAGYDHAIESLLDVHLSKGTYSAFIELHIEQGPILEEEGLKIGIVTAVAAPASLKVDFEGDGGHAGAVLMPFRNDAGLAAAELSLAVEKHVLMSGSLDTVGTTGVFQLHPGAINSIPSKAHLEIDIRDIDEDRRNKVIEDIRSSVSEVATRRGVAIANFEIVNQDPPAHSGSSVIEAIEIAVEQLGLDHKRMISRAYHDSLFMASIAPMGMIFIPCYKGYSHRPDEFASINDIANGVKVLALALSHLSTH
eukprot:c23969_g1_i1 orf=124-1533(+)